MGSQEYSYFFNLDGTITAQEILPEIARQTGLSQEYNDITCRARVGQVPFFDGFKLFIEMLKDVRISTVKEIVSNIGINEKIVSFIRDKKEQCFIVTENLDVWVDELCSKIGCRYFTSKAKTDGDYVIGISHMLEKNYLSNIFSSPFIAVGDNHTDAELMRFAAIGIAFGGVHMPTSAVFDCATHAVFEEDSLCRLLKLL